MYKILLCLRYLKTRYIALACIISVTLGVMTMIVVNAVMAGFSSEMRERIHGILADVVVESTSVDGMPNAEQQMKVIEEAVGEHIEGMTATVEIYGMMSFQYAGQYITRPVTLIGIKPEGKAKVGPLVDYLDSYRAIRKDGVVVREPMRSLDEPPGWNLTEAAKQYRARWKAQARWHFEQMNGKPQNHGTPIESPKHPFEEQPVELPDLNTFQPDDSEEATAENKTGQFPLNAPGIPVDNFQPIEEMERKDNAARPEIKEATRTKQDEEFSAEELAGDPSEFSESDLARELEEDPLMQFSQPEPATLEDLDGPLDHRFYVGAGLIQYQYEDPHTGEVKTMQMVKPGDDIAISTVATGRPPEPVHFNGTVVDVFQSGMSEYDANLIFCNLEQLQQARGMIDPQTGQGAITAVQIKLRNYEHAEEVVKRLRAAFPPGLISVRTWEQKQGPLLSAVEIERAILNVLLFLIITVAGFGILAIFYMIVVEKTRDIGILKALGASSRGVMAIFLSYGLALGIVGAGTGLVGGLLFVKYINQIEAGLTWLTGRKVFDETIYYFPEIPTHVEPWTVTWVAVGAMAIAVLASILPARRAAQFRPVEALRFDQ